MKGKTIVWFVGIILSVGIFLFLLSPNFNGNSIKGDGQEITIYKSTSCGCCTGHSSYLKGKGFSVDLIEMQSVASIKSKYNIPSSMQSCHTAIIGDYFIEGHMPIEAITKLLEEQPDIDGIALPGMPSGSPGMPGMKSGTWTIYAIKNGFSSEFMTI